MTEEACNHIGCNDNNPLYQGTAMDKQEIKIEDKMYSVYDVKAQTYMPPFTAKNDGTAIRHFQQGIRQPGLIQNNPEDFSLWRVGIWYPETGECIKTPGECIAKAHELIARMNADQRNDQAEQLNFVQGGK